MSLSYTSVGTADADEQTSGVATPGCRDKPGATRHTHHRQAYRIITPLRMLRFEWTGPGSPVQYGPTRRQTQIHCARCPQGAGLVRVRL